MANGECFKRNIFVEQLIWDDQQTGRLFTYFVSIGMSLVNINPMTIGILFEHGVGSISNNFRKNLSIGTTIRDSSIWWFHVVTLRVNFISLGWLWS